MFKRRLKTLPLLKPGLLGLCWGRLLESQRSEWVRGVQNPLNGPAASAQCSLSLLPVSPLPLSICTCPLSLHPPISPLLAPPSLPTRGSQRMAVYTESGSAPGFCLFKGSFSLACVANTNGLLGVQRCPGSCFLFLNIKSVMQWDFK